jgi:hypothetical protein
MVEWCQKMREVIPQADILPPEQEGIFYFLDRIENSTCFEEILGLTGQIQVLIIRSDWKNACSRSV